MEDSPFKLCPFCKEQIRREAIKCRFCGEWLESSEPDAARKSTTDEPLVSPPTPPQEATEANSMKEVGRALDRMDQQPLTSPPKQSKPTRMPTRAKIPWQMIVGLFLMMGAGKSLAKP